MNNVKNIAQYIFEEYKRISGETIDEMKLHKLLYFAQREAIAISSSPMFSENFQGWKYGPVCVKVRHAFDTENGIKNADAKKVSTENKYIIRNIIMQYGAFSGWKLSDLSHQEISWKNARKGLKKDENGHRKMSMEDIYKDASKVRPYDSTYDMYYDEFDDFEDVL